MKTNGCMQVKHTMYESHDDSIKPNIPGIQAGCANDLKGIIGDSFAVGSFKSRDY
jgi:hypothetical protein